MAGVLLLSACKKEGLISYPVEKSFPDPTVKLDDLKKVITAGTEGFKMIIRSAAGISTGGYVKFEAGTNAKFLVDNNAQNATTLQESQYNLKISQTNSVVSFAKNGKFGLFAQSAGVDTTYTYKFTVGDTLKFVGDLTGAKMSLIKLAKKDGDEYVAGKMGQLINNVANMRSFKKYFKRLNVGGKSYDFLVNEQTKVITLNYAVGGVFTSFSTRFFYSNSGIQFDDILTDGTVKIGSLNDVQIDVATSTVTLNIGGSPATLTNEIAPVILDKRVATTFASTASKQWSSINGFTKDGVVDYLGFKTIPGFVNVIYWNNTNALGAPNKDLIGIVRANIDYYAGFTRTLPDANGIVKYVQATTIAGGAAAPYNVDPVKTNVTTFINNFRLPAGFYVIQAAPGVYDLVSVADASLWIQFQ